MGYLELPQVLATSSTAATIYNTTNSTTRGLTRELLDTRGVYILDCHADLFVWTGRKSTRLMRTAALRLCTSLEAMIERPAHALLTSTLEGTESQIFKSKFDGWDDLIAVDYTRSADAVNKKNALIDKQQRASSNLAANAATLGGGGGGGGGEREGSVDSLASATPSAAAASSLSHLSLLRAHSASPQTAASVVPSVPASVLPPLLQANKAPLRTDLVALFIDRYEPIGDDEALGMMEETHDFLASMACFVFDQKKKKNKCFVALPDAECGQFYTEESYMFVCRYWKVDAAGAVAATTNASATNDHDDPDDADDYDDNNMAERGIHAAFQKRRNKKNSTCASLHLYLYV